MVVGEASYGVEATCRAPHGDDGGGSGLAGFGPVGCGAAGPSLCGGAPELAGDEGAVATRRAP